MQREMVIVVDADGLIALANEADANHRKAVAISTALIENNATILVPVTAVIEALTALKRGVKRPDLTKTIIDQCVSGIIPVIDVTSDILSPAYSYFNPDGSKKDTFFDAVIVALAKKNDADAIFSFDKGYKKTDVPLISDVLKISKSNLEAVREASKKVHGIWKDDPYESEDD